MAEARPAEKLKVFISYSRRDSSDFVDELVAGLALAGFAPFLDRHDIAAGEKWEERLGGLIEQADTVVFVISPESVKSERCEWEVVRTLKESKRLLPVVFKAVAEVDMPEQLRERQFVRFDGGARFARPLAQLAEALRQDLDWIREHTRLGELAARWDARGRPDSLLLRGEDVAGAQAWVEQRKPDAPGITDAVRAFIAASRDAEVLYVAKSNAARGQIIRMQALALGLLVLVIIGLIGWINQASIAEQWRYVTVTLPYERAQVRPYVLSALKERALKPGESFKDCPQACPEMVVVPGGSYTMGSPPTEKGRQLNEGPQHTVIIAEPFALSKYELTFAEWEACVAGGGCHGYKPSDQGWGGGRQPVINVNWNDAQAYVTWLSQVTGKTYRLPSEAEYEYATRAGMTGAYPWGDDIKLNGQPMADCNGCGSKWDKQQAAPAGSFPPNKFNLSDMVGNVFEWTEDCMHNNYNGAPTDGLPWLNDNGGDCASRVVRAGSWVETPGFLRSAARDGGTTDDRSSDIGFRVVRTLLPP